MAIQINTNSGDALEKIKERDARKRRNTLKGITIGLAAAMGLTAAIYVASGVSAGMKISDGSEKYEAAKAQFEEMKRIAGENEAAITESREDSDTSSVETIDKDMYSARDDGNRVSELLEQAYMDGGLILPEDSAEFKSLTGTSDASWFGAGMDPVKSPLKWEFLTWYDSTDGHKYKTAWGCYAPDGTGKLTYLLYAQYANYDGESGKFSLKGSYTTSFGQMYRDKGYIENDGGPSESGQEIIDIADQLNSGNASGSGAESSSNISFPAADPHGGNAGSNSGQASEAVSEPGPESGSGQPGTGESLGPDIGDVPEIGLF